MENVSRFDLNASIAFWLERVAQSPHLRDENVAEMESHVRDSVTRLQSQGLSEEESFLIAIRRTGSVGKLEPEFAKVNRNWRNLAAHALILCFFSTGCWFLWALSTFPQMMAQAANGMPLPAFSRLVMSCGPYLIVPPLLAAIYCTFVWIRKSGGKNSWVGFFATTMATLALIALPILIEVLLPVIAFMNGRFAAK